MELDAFPIEGLVRVDDLANDRYVFIEVERALKGVRAGALPLGRSRIG